MRNRFVILAGAIVGVGLGLAPLARAEVQPCDCTITPYTIVTDAVKMPIFSRNSQQLMCGSDDTAVTVGYWFQKGAKVHKFTHQGTDSGGEVPVFDDDHDRIIGYQVNVQNDDPDSPLELYDYIQCMPKACK